MSIDPPIKTIDFVQPKQVYEDILFGNPEAVQSPAVGGTTKTLIPNGKKALSR